MHYFIPLEKKHESLLFEHCRYHDCNKVPTSDLRRSRSVSNSFKCSDSGSTHLIHLLELLWMSCSNSLSLYIFMSELVLSMCCPSALPWHPNMTSNGRYLWVAPWESPGDSDERTPHGSCR